MIQIPEHLSRFFLVWFPKAWQFFFVTKTLQRNQFSLIPVQINLMIQITSEVIDDQLPYELLF